MDTLRFLGKFCLLIVVVLAAAAIAAVIGLLLGKVIVSVSGLVATTWATDIPTLTAVAATCGGSAVVIPYTVGRFRTWLFS